MKKYIGIIITFCLVFFVVSCNTKPNNEINNKQFKEYAVKMSKTELEEVNYGNEEYNAFLNDIQKFSLKLSSELYKEDETGTNIVVSPISIYMALAMAAEAASEESREEILDAIGISYEDMLNFTKYLYAESNDEYLEYGRFDNKVTSGFEDLNNSIWIDNNVSLKENTLETLANEYYASTFKVPFTSNSKEAGEVLSKYIKEATRGLIDRDFEFSNETIFAIVNTYYLKDIWNKYGKDLNFGSDIYNFVNYDNSVNPVKLLQGYYFNGKPYVTESYRYAATFTENGFKLKFIVPNDGYSIDDVFTSDNLETINLINNYLSIDDERKEINHTRCFFPEFEANYNQDVKSTLADKFGIKSIFDSSTANLSNLVDGKAYINEVIHQTKLIVNRKGIEGAAITVSPTAGDPGPGPYINVYHDFIIDRAFGFIITDNKDTVLFSGVIRNVE